MFSGIITKNTRRSECLSRVGLAGIGLCSVLIAIVIGWGAGCASSSKVIRRQHWRSDQVLRSEVAPILTVLESGNISELTAVLMKTSVPKDNPYYWVAQSIQQIITTLQSAEIGSTQLSRERESFGSPMFFSKAFKIVANIDSGLATADMLLEKAEGYPQLKWVANPGGWEIDWNKDGRVSRMEKDRLKFMFDEDGRFLPKSDARRSPIVAFDQSDVFWLRSYLGFSRAFLAFIQSYDWSVLGQLLNGSNSMSSMAALELKVPIRDQSLANSIGSQIQRAVALAKQCRTFISKETDSDREWVPSPRQVGATPHRMTEAIFGQWGKTLGDIDDLLTGETGLSLREAISGVREIQSFAVDGFLDIHALLDRPAAIEIATADLLAFAMMPASQKGAILKKILRSGFNDKMKASPITREINGVLPSARQDMGVLRRLGSLFFWLN